MKLRLPTICTRCGLGDHRASGCNTIQKFGLSEFERDYADERRRDRNVLLATLVLLILVHVLVAVICGVEP